MTTEPTQQPGQPWEDWYRQHHEWEHGLVEERIAEMLAEIRTHGPDREISWDAGDEEIDLLLANAHDREAVRLLVSDQVEAALRIHAETDCLDYTVDVLTDDGKIAVQFQGPAGREQGRREIDILRELEAELEPGTMGADEAHIARSWRALFAKAVKMCDAWLEREAGEQQGAEH